MNAESIETCPARPLLPYLLMSCGGVLVDCHGAKIERYDRDVPCSVRRFGWSLPRFVAGKQKLWTSDRGRPSTLGSHILGTFLLPSDIVALETDDLPCWVPVCDLFSFLKTLTLGTARDRP